MSCEHAVISKLYYFSFQEILWLESCRSFSNSNIVNWQLAFSLQKKFKLCTSKLNVEVFSKVARCIYLFLENKLGMTRTVKAYCLNIDLKHVFPGVVHFSRIRWFWLEVNERIWKIPFFKCHSTDQSHTLKHLLSTFPVCLFSLPKKGCLLGEQSQAILTAWTVLRVCKKSLQSKQ